MGAAGLLPIAHVLQKQPRAHDMLAFAAGFFDGRLDDLKAAFGLAIEIAGTSGAAAGQERRGAGNGNMRPYAHRARKADLRLVYRAG